MIGAQTQAGVGPARRLVEAPASERDCRRQLMRRWVLWTRVQDPIARSCRAFDPPSAQLRQSVLKRRLPIGSWLCHRVPSSAPYSSDRFQREHKPNEAPPTRIAQLEPPWTAPGDIAIVSRDGICAAHRSRVGHFYPCLPLAHRGACRGCLCDVATQLDGLARMGRRRGANSAVVQAVVGRFWQRDGALFPLSDLSANGPTASETLASARA